LNCYVQFTDCPIIIENGTFSWGTNEPPVLKGINIKCNEKSLVAVVGTVGAGKSSLISAFLGEMEKITGRVNTKVSSMICFFLIMYLLILIGNFTGANSLCSTTSMDSECDITR